MSRILEFNTEKDSDPTHDDVRLYSATPDLPWLRGDWILIFIPILSSYVLYHGVKKTFYTP